jgi:rSAM/selenodomain-associated transferase 1
MAPPNLDRANERDVRDRALAIMAKAPRPGHVKTRLAGALAADDVVALYECLIEDTLRLARSVRTDALAVVCPADDADDLATWFPGIDILAQRGQGLAAGLASVFRIFGDRGYRSIIALGGDSPHLDRETIEDAFRRLDVADVVVGPTIDGGYYLVGAGVADGALFDEGTLGTGRALDSLLTRARERGLRVALTAEAYDVDEQDDLERLADDLRLAPGAAPRTAAWLAEWRARRGR